MTMKPKDVIELAKANDVKFIDVKFVDFPGQWQHTTLPAYRLDESEDDPLHLGTTSLQPFDGLLVCRVEARVVGQFARLRHAGVEDLATVVAPGSAVALQQLLAALRERHHRRPFLADDVRHGLHKSVVAQSLHRA